MADNTAGNGTGAATGAAATQKATRNTDLLNAGWLDELKLASDVAQAARVQGRADALAAEGVTQAFAIDLQGRIKQAGDLVTAIETAHSDSGGATRNEGDAHTALIKAAGSIQSGARRKFSRTQPERLKLYACGGGADLSKMNRTQLTTAIPTLIDTAKADGLSGANNAKTNAVQVAFDAWNSFDAAQTGAVTEEGTARATLKTLLLGPDFKSETGIIADRRTIQYAADSAWAPGSNLPIRREFHLQDNRRFAG